MNNEYILRIILSDLKHLKNNGQVRSIRPRGVPECVLGAELYDLLRVIKT